MAQEMMLTSSLEPFSPWLLCLLPPHHPWCPCPYIIIFVLLAPILVVVSLFAGLSSSSGAVAVPPVLGGLTITEPLHEQGLVMVGWVRGPVIIIT